MTILKTARNLYKVYSGKRVPQILNSVLNQAEKRYKHTKLRSKPISLTIETTNRCIFRCEMCPRNADTVRKEGDMSLETFNKIKPLLRTALSVNLGGFGETLLNKNFFNMLRSIKSYHCYTKIFTNGYLLTPNVCDAIVDTGLDEMVISIDGNSSKTYDDIRKGGDYSRLISNINVLNNKKKIRGTKYPVLNMNFMAMKKNITELPDIVDLASRYGFKRISAQNFAVFSKELEDQSLFNHVDFAGKYIKEAEERAKTLGIDLSVPYFGYKKTRCYDPFSTMYIAWDGVVTTCASQTYIMGDLNQTNVIDIWNNVKYQKLRERFAKNRLPQSCKNCFMHVNSKKTFVDYPQKLIKEGLEGRIRYDLQE